MKYRILPWGQTVLAFAILVWAGAINRAQGYAMRGPLTLEQLANDPSRSVEVIFKGIALSNREIKDAKLSSMTQNGMSAHETVFSVICFVKGKIDAKTVAFRHYDTAPNPPQVGSPGPQHFHFEAGKPYIVFADKSKKGVLPLRQSHHTETSKGDQGVLLCSDTEPVSGFNITEIFWNELCRSLKSPATASYALRQLDEMSDGSSWHGTHDFDRAKVIAAIAPLISSTDPQTAKSAINAIASSGPYLSNDYDIGQQIERAVETDGFTKFDPRHMPKLDAETVWKELAALASGTAPGEVRAQAVRALGLLRKPELMQSIPEWAADKSPDVRAATAVLLADYPGDEGDRLLALLSKDPEPMVRACAARGIGYGRRCALADTLASLLGDPDKSVRRIAGFCLASFSPKNKEIERLFIAHRKDQEFGPIFLNRLARENPEPYLDELALVLKLEIRPKNASGSQPEFFDDPGDILYSYLAKQPAKDFQSGKLDRFINAFAAKYGAILRIREFYALCLCKGLTERAAKFKAAAQGEIHNMSPNYFEDVEKNPEAFLKEWCR